MPKRMVSSRRCDGCTTAHPTNSLPMRFILRMKPEGLMKRGIAALLTAGCFTVGSLSVAPAAEAADVFTLTSPAVQDNGMLAVKNAGSDKQRSPNCVGENVSPPLTWSNPAGRHEDLCPVAVRSGRPRADGRVAHGR